MTFATGFEPLLTRNAELAERAKKKAKALDDGSRVGQLKGQMILALDQCRSKRELVRFWGVFAVKEGGRFYQEQHALAQVDLREAKDAASKLAADLEELGIHVNLVRRKDYLIDGG